MKIEKGQYGYIKAYRKKRLIIALICLALIVALLVACFLIFETRKTWLAIIACVIAIPFARNVTDIIMSMRVKPLSQKQYEKVNEETRWLRQEEYDGEIGMVYDLSLTRSEGIGFIPCAYIMNNNVIIFSPKDNTAKEKEKLEKYADMVNEDKNISCRIVTTNKLDSFVKEIKKIKVNEKTDFKNDKRIFEKLKTLGF